MKRFDLEALPMGVNDGKYAGSFTSTVKSIIKSVLQGSVLHLYSGSSFMGDERVDLAHPNATLNCKVEEFIGNDRREWDWCLLDPPYAISQKSKLRDYEEVGSLSGNVAWRRQIKEYLRHHVDNVLWLDFCAPTILGFGRQKLWLLLPGGFHTVRVLSWLKREMKPLIPRATADEMVEK